jgi:crotonobetainyl-CoA:carnitine CoA-transferase CaiB-like acyl-CoA transferase
VSELNREEHMPGPLSRLRVVELQGRGPGPFGAMMLADLGANVVRIARLEDLTPAGTPAALSTPPPAAGQHTTEVLLEWGFSRAEVDLLLGAGVVGQAQG